MARRQPRTPKHTSSSTGTSTSASRVTPSRQATPRSSHNLSSKPSVEDEKEESEEEERNGGDNGNGNGKQINQDDDEEPSSSTTTTPKNRRGGEPTRARIAFSAETVGGEDDDNDNDNGKNDAGETQSSGKNVRRESNPQDAGLGNNTTGNTLNGGPLHNNTIAGDASKRNSRPSRRRPRNSKPTSSPLSSPLANSTGDATTTTTTTTTTTSSWKRRKRGRRLVRVVQVSSNDRPPPPRVIQGSFPPLPGNQYSTILRRRAIRKLEDVPSHPNDDNTTTTTTNHTENPDYGDISLGMKLIVAGGRVIVQTLNALSDGRASPAQLTGVIQRGDVLLAVGDVSLTQLPIDQLMTGLKPLSAPEGPDGRYRRVLRLRFEAGVGHALLRSHERGLSPRSAAAADGAAVAVQDMFALFPMVDQLSGAPLIFDQPSTATMAYHSKEDKAKEEAKEVDEGPSTSPKSLKQEQEQEDLVNTSGSQDATSNHEQRITPDEMISVFLVKERMLDRERFSSEFFNWNERFSELLKQATLDHATNEDCLLAMGAGLTRSERIVLGQKVMKLAKSLTYSMEDMDKGKDLRSFKTWSTNFSLRSGASARRRIVMDAASLRSHRHHQQDNANDSSDMDDSLGSAGSGSFGSVDGDALLLGLAAHDDIWRKQVIEALKRSIEKMENGEESEDEGEKKEASDQKPGDINAALTNELGAFLFGENMNNIIQKAKKSYALPPEDITTVLFDLITHITTAAPDQVTLFGGGTTNSVSYQSSFGTTTQGKVKAQLRTDIMLANRFMLDEVLPVWLESFRPLGLEQRRLFWPKVRRGSGGSYGGTATLVSDSDSLTVDSNGSGQKGTGRGTTKDLQEMIEDMELDVETRAETCFLVTYYFTQQILSKYSSCTSESEMEPINKEVALFAQKFGTYLQIHSCLAFSASVEAEKAVDELLTVARHDPSHRDAVKEIQKAKDLTFYDAGKLSAVLEFLHKVRYETKQRRKVIQNLCVAAYPDVQPWQVKRACLDPLLVDGSKKACSDETLRDFYYSYLSRLLDPVEGHEDARHDTKLIKEWCEWSIGVNNGQGETRDRDKLQNFYKVASRTSSAHLAYRRDLPTLLEMSMGIKEYNLALELTTEIIEDRKLCGRTKTIYRVLVCLREIGMAGLALAWEGRKDGNGFHTLKRVLRAFHQMSTSKFDSCRDSIDVPKELLTLLVEWQRKIKSKDSSTSDLLALVDFVITESAPIDVLSALVLWSTSNELGPALFSRLDSLLRRGVQVALKSELSGSLLRLKYIRRGYTDENKSLMPSDERNDDKKEDGGIWKRMSLGNLSIDK